MSLLTVNEVAERLRVSAEIVYVLCRPDKITKKASLANYRIGTRVLVAEEDLLKYLDNNRTEASYS